MKVSTKYQDKFFMPSLAEQKNVPDETGTGSDLRDKKPDPTFENKPDSTFEKKKPDPKIEKKERIRILPIFYLIKFAFYIFLST